MKKTVCVATFNEVEPAERLRERLAEAGVPSIVSDESKVDRFWFIPKKFAAIHVEVTPDRYLNTRRLLHNLDESEGVLKNAVLCPDCGSSRIEYPQFSRKFIVPNLIGILIALKIVAPRFYCQDCQYTWTTVVPLEPQRDDLGWPVKPVDARRR